MAWIRVTLMKTQLKSKLGISVLRLPLEQVFSLARQTTPEQIAPVRQLLDTHLDNLAELEQKPLNGTLSVYRALRTLAEQEQLGGLAVRCWPEFFTDLGCSACGAMSMLSDGLDDTLPHSVQLRSRCQRYSHPVNFALVSWRASLRHGYRGNGF